MDQKDLSVERYDAGRNYLNAIRNLNLEPEALFWAYDKSMERFVLVLVTSLFDFAGPLALTKLLFKAYNAAATPREIDPFIVRLHSPDHTIYRAMENIIGNRTDLPDLKGAHLDRATIAGTVSPAIVVSFKSGDLEGFGTWVYKSTPRGAEAKKFESERRWGRFERAVHKLAA